MTTNPPASACAATATGFENNRTGTTGDGNTAIGFGGGTNAKNTASSNVGARTDMLTRPSTSGSMIGSIRGQQPGLASSSASMPPERPSTTGGINARRRNSFSITATSDPSSLRQNEFPTDRSSNVFASGEAKNNEGTGSTFNGSTSTTGGTSTHGTSASNNSDVASRRPWEAGKTSFRERMKEMNDENASKKAAAIGSGKMISPLGGASRNWENFSRILPSGSTAATRGGTSSQFSGPKKISPPSTTKRSTVLRSKSSASETLIPFQAGGTGKDVDAMELHRRMDDIWENVNVRNEDDDDSSENDDGAGSLTADEVNGDGHGESGGDTTKKRHAPKSFDKAVQETLELLHAAFNDVHQDGIAAFHGWQKAKGELNAALEESISKKREVERLRQSEQAHKKTISNLLRTIESSTKETRDLATQASMNHKVRDELLKMMEERDKAMNEAKEIKEALSMSKDQLNNANTEMKKLTQENALLKRDQRQLLVMATQNQSSTGGSSNTWDLEYYKRKVEELNTRIQGLKAAMTEKDRQLEEARRVRDRSLSQHRISQIRSEENHESDRRLKKKHKKKHAS